MFSGASISIPLVRGCSGLCEGLIVYVPVCLTHAGWLLPEQMDHLWSALLISHTGCKGYWSNTSWLSHFQPRLLYVKQIWRWHFSPALTTTSINIFEGTLVTCVCVSSDNSSVKAFYLISQMVMVCASLAPHFSCYWFSLSVRGRDPESREETFSWKNSSTTAPSLMTRTSAGSVFMIQKYF